MDITEFVFQDWRQSLENKRTFFHPSFSTNLKDGVTVWRCIQVKSNCKKPENVVDIVRIRGGNVQIIISSQTHVYTSSEEYLAGHY